MSFGLTFDKLLIILVIAVFVIGPDRLPGYAAQLARLVRSLRDLANGAKDRMREEMGPEFDEVDWTKLDPRQYDPRRIIRDALLDDPAPVKPVTATMAAAPRRRRARQGTKAMGDTDLQRVATYLRQIERLAAVGDLEAIAREARLALHICDQADPVKKAKRGGAKR